MIFSSTMTTEKKSLSKVTLHSHKHHQIYQWCGDTNQDDLKVVWVIFTKVQVREYSENVFASNIQQIGFKFIFRFKVK